MLRTLPTVSFGGLDRGLPPPASAHYVKAFGTLGADSLASSANREPRVALFYATDDDTAAGTVERVIRAAARPGEGSGFGRAGRLEGRTANLSQGGLKASCSTRPGSRNPAARVKEVTRPIETSDLPERARPAIGARPGPQRAGLLRSTRRGESLLDHRRHVPVRIPDHFGRRRRSRRSRRRSQQHPACDRRDRIGQRREQQGQLSRLLAPIKTPDHVGAASLLKERHADRSRGARKLLLRDDDPARPPNEETFQDRRTLETAASASTLRGFGANHSPDNIIIHLPDTTR